MTITTASGYSAGAVAALAALLIASIGFALRERRKERYRGEHTSAGRDPAWRARPAGPMSDLNEFVERMNDEHEQWRRQIFMVDCQIAKFAAGVDRLEYARRKFDGRILDKLTETVRKESRAREKRALRDSLLLRGLITA
jgi:hypothetical protein